jgi:hypothetical protein
MIYDTSNVTFPIDIYLDEEKLTRVRYIDSDEAIVAVCDLDAEVVDGSFPDKLYIGGELKIMPYEDAVWTTEQAELVAQILNEYNG